jgi:hypothetical protein
MEHYTEMLRYPDGSHVLGHVCAPPGFVLAEKRETYDRIRLTPGAAEAYLWRARKEYEATCKSNGGFWRYLFPVRGEGQEHDW